VGGKRKYGQIVETQSEIERKGTRTTRVDERRLFVTKSPRKTRNCDQFVGPLAEIDQFQSGKIIEQICGQKRSFGRGFRAEITRIQLAVNTTKQQQKATDSFRFSGFYRSFRPFERVSFGFKRQTCDFPTPFLTPHCRRFRLVRKRVGGRVKHRELDSIGLLFGRSPSFP
jgi:hypothetical protein